MELKKGKRAARVSDSFRARRDEKKPLVLSHMQILLIEPDKILAGNIKIFFKRRGHKVIVQTSAQAGILAADKLKPDAVILDLQLSGHSGVEFLHELRSHADWQNLPVIVFSSLSPNQLGGEDVAKAGLTISAYVHKSSSSLAQLAEAVEQTLSK